MSKSRKLFLRKLGLNRYNIPETIPLVIWPGIRSGTNKLGDTYFNYFANLSLSNDDVYLDLIIQSVIDSLLSQNKHTVRQ